MNEKNHLNYTYDTKQFNAFKECKKNRTNLCIGTVIASWCGKVKYVY